MSEGVLTILKFCLMALLYLFVGRVVWVVASELRAAPLVAPTPGRRDSTATPTKPPRGARRKGWRLTADAAEGEGGDVYYVDGELTLGRAGGCGIPLTDDTYASSVHARVFERDGNAWVEDLGSTNGTYVNGTQIGEPHRLRKGDRIQAGSTVFEVSR
ncbi:MAG: FHA domain-containing protein [Acidimicrobiia bacterium]|nr:FHA domain-containing protein [Acidimicrobiia bacterium]